MGGQVGDDNIHVCSIVLHFPVSITKLRLERQGLIDSSAKLDSLCKGEVFAVVQSARKSREKSSVG